MLGVGLLWRRRERARPDHRAARYLPARPLHRGFTIAYNVIRQSSQSERRPSRRSLASVDSVDEVLGAAVTATDSPKDLSGESGHHRAIGIAFFAGGPTSIDAVLALVGQEGPKPRPALGLGITALSLVVMPLLVESPRAGAGLQSVMADAKQLILLPSASYSTACSAGGGLTFKLSAGRGNCSRCARPGGLAPGGVSRRSKVLRGPRRRDD